ncbi:MAG: glutathione S-transferase family protein [Sphingomonadaceae bacterium]|nr:glutathione S-transferase family protein [Sphingomonadaceae bacterium]
MALHLFYHPFSSYCWKALIPLYRAGTAFQVRLVNNGDAATDDEWRRLWPLAKMPLLVDDGRVVTEASIIVEYLDRHHPGSSPLIPSDADTALEVRALDRFFDNYIHAPTQAIVGDRLRAPETQDPVGVAQAHDRLETALGWLDAHMDGRAWAVGDAFTLADCAAAPPLFYSDWVHPWRDRFPNAAAYRARLNATPEMSRCIKDARYFREYFPGGAPDQD